MKTTSSRGAIAVSLLVLILGYWVTATAQEASLSSGGKWGPVQEGFALKLEVPAPGASLTVGIFAPEEAVALPTGLKATIRNASSTEVTTTWSRPESDYWLVMVNLDGNVVKSLDPFCGTRSKSPDAAWPLRPGQEIVDIYDVSKARYSVPPGEYLIKMERLVPPLVTPEGEIGWGHVLQSDSIFVRFGKDMQVTAADPATGPAATRLLAVRPALERQGYTLQWDETEQRATATKGSVVVSLQAGTDLLTLAGQTEQMAGAARVVNGELMAPALSVARVVAFVARDPNTYYPPFGPGT